MSLIVPKRCSAECHSAMSPNSIQPGARRLSRVKPGPWGPATGPKARPIPAWGNAPGIESHTQQGLKARPIFPHRGPIATKPTQWDSPRHWRSGIGWGRVSWGVAPGWYGSAPLALSEVHLTDLAKNSSLSHSFAKPRHSSRPTLSSPFRVFRDFRGSNFPPYPLNP